MAKPKMTDQDVSEQLVKEENLLRLNEQLKALREQRQQIDGQIKLNREKVISESKWRQLVEYVRQKLMGEHIARQEQLMAVNNVQSKEYADAKRALDESERYFKSKVFLSKVEDTAERMCGLDKNPVHQHLKGERSALDAKIEQFEKLAANIEKTAGSTFDRGQTVKMPMVMTGKQLHTLLDGDFIKLERETRQELETRLAITQKEVSAHQYVLADKDKLYREAVVALHPEFARNDQRQQQIQDAIKSAEEKLRDLHNEGIKQKFTKDGSVSRLRPDFTKSATRLAWESRVNTTARELAERTVLLKQVEQSQKKCLVDIKKNTAEITRHMRDNFKPDYKLDPTCKEIEDRIKWHGKNIQAATFFTAKLTKDPAGIYNIPSNNPWEIVKDAGVKKQIEKVSQQRNGQLAM